MNVTIYVPYENAEQTPLFASSERTIDWHTNQVAADRCTIAFAATEIATRLETVSGGTVTFISGVAEVRATTDPVSIQLRIVADDRSSGSFTISPLGEGVDIAGSDRVGVLYGAYEFLRYLGWSWLEPGSEGEYAPSQITKLNAPGSVVSRSPAFPRWRGFDFSFMSKESEEFLLWMARNRLNLAGFRTATSDYGRKLGMLYKNGGHIFERILDPENITESGETFWNDHFDWYGTPRSGDKSVEGALQTQFCVSQPDLLSYLGEELIKRIESEWYEADLVAVWGFDTWGSCCTCDSCKNLGNDSDQYLHLLSSLRSAIDDAIRDGRVRRGVRMAGCAYEGTSTLVGPEHEIPSNLRNAEDAIIYYPIDRSYAANLLDDAEERNRPYASALRSWIDRPDALPIIIGEYYNVSKFEDLPALFSSCIRNDLAEYHELGVQGMTYMHVPMVNWAMRAQTQVLYADSCWSGADYDKRVDASYFVSRYGPFAPRLTSVYRDIELAFARISEWRAWHRSILDFLLKWNGLKPDAPMRLPSCFENVDDVIASGRETVILLLSAQAEIAACQAEERSNPMNAFEPSIRRAENPLEAMGHKTFLTYERVLGEDLRLLRYGIDTMEAMIEAVAYYDAFRSGDADSAETAWRSLTACVERLGSYWVPISYEHPGPGLRSLDGYSRTQLAGVVNRCRLARIDN